jgi:hypothetical protein
VNVGALHLSPADLSTLADLLTERVAERLDVGREWYTTAQYAEKGYAPSVEAARKRAYRLERKGSEDVQRRGGRYWLRGPA